MNLADQFNLLIIPTESEGKVYNASTIPWNSNFKIAINKEAYPVLLCSVSNISSSILFKNFRLKYLELTQNIECKVTIDYQTYLGRFSLITFTSTNISLQNYFFKIAETIIKSLSVSPTQNEILETLNKFVEIFQSMENIPSKSIQGLWAELFLIANSKEPKILLSFWHNNPEEKFDFNSGNEKIEVKSSSNYERRHFFTSEQLNPPNNTTVVIASILVRLDSKGQTIQDLVDSISNRIQDIDLIKKLNSTVLKTLGSSLEQSFYIKYDELFSKSCIRLYLHTKIAKVKEIDIPVEVSGVKFISDLSNVEFIDNYEFQQIGILFNAI